VVISGVCATFVWLKPPNFAIVPTFVWISTCKLESPAKIQYFHQPFTEYRSVLCLKYRAARGILRRDTGLEILAKNSPCIQLAPDSPQAVSF
jgi:hypothetical protein